METEEQFKQWDSARKKARTSFFIASGGIAILCGIYYFFEGTNTLIWIEKYRITVIIALFSLWQTFKAAPFITLNIQRNHRI